MDETIHIYIDALLKKDDHTITSTKRRLWPSLIVSLRWLLQSPTSNRTIIQNGFGLMAVNSLAIVVEGFLADILIDHLNNHDIDSPREITIIENSNWTSKVKIYDKKFPNVLANCPSYKTIEMLLLLRNNTAHGRTHREKEVRNTETLKSSGIESFDKNYQKVKEYLQERNVIKKIEINSNVELLWSRTCLHFFITEVRFFMYQLLEVTKSNNLSSIKSELNNAFNMTL